MSRVLSSTPIGNGWEMRVGYRAFSPTGIGEYGVECRPPDDFTRKDEYLIISPMDGPLSIIVDLLLKQVEVARSSGQGYILFDYDDLVQDVTRVVGYYPGPETTDDAFEIIAFDHPNWNAQGPLKRSIFIDWRTERPEIEATRAAIKEKKKKKSSETETTTTPLPHEPAVNPDQVWEEVD